MATNTTNTFTNHTGNGTEVNFGISFNYILTSDIDVTVAGVLKTLGTHYTISGATVTFTSGNVPPNGAAIKIERDTSISNKAVDFQDGSVLTEQDLDNNSNQVLFAQQEILEDYFKRDGSQTLTGNLVFEGATDDDNETTLAITDPTADRTITVPDISGTLVTTGDTGTVTSTMITDGTIVNGDIANNTITGSKLVDNTITSTQIGADAVTASELANNSVDTNAVQDDAITYSKIQNVSATDRILGRDSAGAGAIEELTPSDVRTMINVEDGADVTDATNVNAAGAVMNSDTSTTAMQFVIDEDDFASNSDTKIPTQQSSKNYIASVAQPLDNELTILAGMQSGTASKLADSTALTADIADLNQLDGLTKQTTITNSDASFPTSGAVVDFVAAQIAPIGGLEVIPNDQAFPDTQPQSGVVISIADAGGLVVTPSGVSTTGRTVGGSTVTINNINSAFNNSTVDNGVAFMVSSTGNNQVYNFHKATLKEADILALSGDINDFAERYRVGASNPTTSLDQGDLFFNTSNQKLFVYNGTIWDEVQSVGNFHISGFNESIDGSRQDFTINNAPANAQQVLLSINGVVQKPNSGNSTPSEGFALNGNIIKLASPPPSGSSVFVTVMGSTVDIGTPSDNTVTSAILQNGSVQTAKIADQAVTLDKLLHGDANSDGKFLRANNGADPTFETIDLTNLSASNLTSGTIPAARFGTDTIATGSLAAGALPTDVTIADANISGNLTIADADINSNAAIALTKLATGALPTGITIASANLVDGTIVNADINASAAIANSKLADSGVSAGTVGSSTAIPILTVNAKGIITATSTTAIDSTTIANGSSSVSVANNGAITSNANHDFSAGIDVTGNITVTGTVDGVDIATRDTLFGGLTSSSGVLSNGVAATTQGASDNTTKVATTAYVTTAINNLINGAPSALDTLNELAAAMNDDAAFSTTVTNSLATKMPLAGGQFTGNITFSGSQTVDGRDLSVDGAKLDGIAAGATNVTNTNQLTNGAGFLTSVGTSNIADAAITTAKLNDSSVTQAKIANGAVVGTKLADDAVGTAKIADGAVNTARLANSAVTSDKLNNSAVTFAKFQNVAQNHILGRSSSGTGQLQQLSASSIRTILNVENGATADQSGSEIATALRGEQIGTSTDGVHNIYNDSYYRSNTSGVGLYSQANGNHWYSDSASYYNITGSGGAIGIRFRDSHDSTIRGYVYANNSTQIGFLDNGGNWSLRTDRGGNTTTLFDQHFNSDTNETYDLGSTSARWKSVHAKFLHFGSSSRYLGPISGDYGTVQVYGEGANNWEGYSIDGRVVFMHDGSNSAGIYNDVNNEWMVRTILNGAVELYHNGSLKLHTGTTGVGITGECTPTANNSYNLGHPSYRWANLYVNDMHFANSEENPNKVDGTWGDWTLQEGEDTIYMLNNRNGKKYKMNLTEV